MYKEIHLIFLFGITGPPMKTAFRVKRKSFTFPKRIVANHLSNQVTNNIHPRVYSKQFKNNDLLLKEKYHP